MQIIIVTYNAPDEEKRCIESVKKYTNLDKHKLTIFDNFKNGNINLGKLWNQLIEASEQEVICLLNSDTVVEEGWTRLEDGLSLNSLEHMSFIGAVGPVTDNCGTAQKGMSRSESIEEINDLSGFCYVFRKSLWEEVGGFPEDMPFYGQESIFNRKLQDRGYKMMVDRRVFVHHEKGASYKKAIERGETTSEEETWGAFHYYNYLDRLRVLRSVVGKEFKMVVIDGGRDNPFPLHKGMEQAVDEFFGGNGLILRSEQCIPEILDLFQPDFILNTETKHNDFVSEFLKQAKREGIKTALYFSDMRCPVTEACGTEHAMRVDLSPYYDAVFLCNETHRPCWESVCKVPTFYMPQGSIQHPKPPKGEEHHILHVGAEGTGHYHENRFSILRDLRKKVEVTTKNSSDRDKRAIIEEKSYGDYHSSDFSLAISMEVGKYSSIRLWNIVGAGGCALAYKAMGLDDMLNDREHVLWFRTAEEALKIIERTTEEEREAIKLNAFKHTQKHGTTKMRLLNILQNLYTDDKSFKGDLSNLWKIGK